MINWISCKERMPEKYGKYLVTIEDRDGSRFVRIAEWEFDVADEDIAVDGKFYDSTFIADSDWGYDLSTSEIHNIIAWTSIPEAYKGE